MKVFLKRIPGLLAVARLVRVRPTQRPRKRLLTRLPKRSVGAEIGVHEGDYSVEILRVVNPAVLHLIDPWEHEEGEAYRDAWYGGGASEGQATMDHRFRSVRTRFAEAIDAGRVVLHRGYSGDVAGQFDDGHFDWVYIDGNHLYEYVKLDLESYYPKVKPGGYLCGDDYGVAGWWDNGVQKAVEEFVGQRPRRSLEVDGNQFMIRKE